MSLPASAAERTASDSQAPTPNPPETPDPAERAANPKTAAPATPLATDTDLKPASDWTRGWRFFLSIYLRWGLGIFLAGFCGAPGQHSPGYTSYTYLAGIGLVIAGLVRFVPDDRRKTVIRYFTLLWVLFICVAASFF